MKKNNQMCNQNRFIKVDIDEGSYDISSKLLSERIIFLEHELNEKKSCLIVAELLYLEAQNPRGDVQLYINCSEGSVRAALAVYDTMQYIKCNVAVTCIGIVAGWSTLLLAGGTKGKRVSLPNAEVMICQPAIEDKEVSGQATDLKIISEYMLQNKLKMSRILSVHTGRTQKEILADIERNKYMDAQEAKKYGIIDRVLN